MGIQELIIEKTNINICQKLFMISVVSLFFFACKKDAVGPEYYSFSRQAPKLQLSTSKLVLLEANAKNTAITFNWASGAQGSDETVNYTIESATGGSQFADPVVIASTDQLSASFTVGEFNCQMRKLIIAGAKRRVEFRIRSNKPHNSTNVYSDPIALDVTAYQKYIEYDNSHIIRIPGNYQDWKLVTAPKIVSSEIPGEYEGYINFTNPYSQFLMVKGATQWDPNVTYQYIGANKFGFGGSVFSIFGGAGMYRLKVNTNTNTWSYTRINTWGLNGNAVSNDANAEAEMQFNETTLSWSITANLVKGDFRFRANKSNAINFGHNTSAEIGVPNYNGESIPIAKPGNYTITLELTLAGNYAYSVQKNK